MPDLFRRSSTVVLVQAHNPSTGNFKAPRYPAGTKFEVVGPGPGKTYNVNVQPDQGFKSNTGSFALPIGKIVKLSEYKKRKSAPGANRIQASATARPGRNEPGEISGIPRAEIRGLRNLSTPKRKRAKSARLVRRKGE